MIPTWDRKLGTLLTCLDTTLAPGRWGTDVCVDRQREDRHRRARRRGPGAASDDRRGGPALRADRAHLCPVRPRVQGRVGGHGADREGRPGPDQGEPAHRLQLVRRAGRGVRGVRRSRSTTGSIARPTGSRPKRCWSSRRRLHPIPAAPFTAALGETRSVATDQTIRFGSVRYSTPPGLVGREVWVRADGEELVITANRTTTASGPGRGGPAPAVDAGEPADRPVPLPRPSPTARRVTEAAAAQGPQHARRRRSSRSGRVRTRGWSRPPRSARSGSGRR